MTVTLLSFNQVRAQAIKSENKVAFIIDVFQVLHNDAPPEDLKGLGGRLAGILKQCGNDYLRVLQVIWIASAMGIQGSHLNYIQGMMRNGKQKPTEERKVPWKDVGDIKKGE